MFKAIKEFFLGKPVEVQPAVVTAPYKVEAPVEAAPAEADKKVGEKKESA